MCNLFFIFLLHLVCAEGEVQFQLRLEGARQVHVGEPSGAEKIDKEKWEYKHLTHI